MERKQDFQQGKEMLQNSNIPIKGDDHEDDDDESLEVFKKEISCHSLYGQLVHTHLDCLKLCLGNMENNVENAINPSVLPNGYPNFFAADHSELDQFMEAYCVSLNKLKEVMEEPQQESMAFINFMYSQLEDLLHIPSSRDSESKG